MKVKNNDLYFKLSKQNSFAVLGKYAIKYVKKLIYRKLTANSANLFLRPLDFISTDPIIDGIHEPRLALLLRELSSNNYNDFLIDIGANIGLTSCGSGKFFKEVHMYEPNPLCCHILSVNAEICLSDRRHVVNWFGLGEADATKSLTIPRHNWGGGFIDDRANFLSQEMLYKKDGLKSIGPITHFNRSVTIKDCFSELNKLFNELVSKNLLRGVIKIDVEGYERELLTGIARAIPRDCSLYIVFESWDPNFPIGDVVSKFNREVQVGKISSNVRWKPHWPKLLRAILLLFPQTIRTIVCPPSDNNLSGDIILYVK